MGRYKEPIERMQTLAKGDGRTPGKREIVVHAPIPRKQPIPVMPDTILPDSRGEAEWYKVWESGWWLHPDQDYHWIEMIAIAYNDMTEFRRVVIEEGLVVTGWNGQPAAHPLIAEIRKAEQVVQKCLSIIGFSPHDRAKLGYANEKAKNEGLRGEIMARLGKK